MPRSSREAPADGLAALRRRGRRPRRLPVQRDAREEGRADEVPAGVLGRRAADGTRRAGGLVAVDGLLQPRLDAVCAELVPAVQLRPRLHDALRVREADRVVADGALLRRRLLGRAAALLLVVVLRRRDVFD